VTAYETASSVLKSSYGIARLHVFSFGPHEEDNILCVDARRADRSGAPEAPTLVRVQSACYTAEIFRSVDCDCHEQLDLSLELVHGGGGLLVYMLCDGRGAGLLTKVRGLALGEAEGLDTHDAYVRLGVPPDPRDYGRVAAALTHLDVTSLNLLTNNPRKIAALQDAGFAVTHQPLQIEATEGSRPYLETKRAKMGHLLE
jgi:GTP cyclohydrolase II